MTLRAPILSLLCLAFLSAPCAAKDIFIAILKLKDGTVEPHQQVMTGNLCDKALDAFRKERDQGNTFILTLQDPEVTGTVLQMNCVRPDATIWGPDGIVVLPQPPQR